MQGLHKPPQYVIKEAASHHLRSTVVQHVTGQASDWGSAAPKGERPARRPPEQDRLRLQRAWLPRADPEELPQTLVELPLLKDQSTGVGKPFASTF